jgi:hypothetical protein
VAVLPSPGTDEPDSSPSATAPTGSASTTPSESLPTAVPATAPADVTWQLLGQVALPYSGSALSKPSYSAKILALYFALYVRGFARAGTSGFGTCSLTG